MNIYNHVHKLIIRIYVFKYYVYNVQLQFRNISNIDLLITLIK
jgi:hypothetical protein